MDAEWRSVYGTTALRAAAGFLVDTETDPPAAGSFMFGREQLDLFASTPIGAIALDYVRVRLEHVGEWVVQDLGGGRERLRALIDPRLDDVVDRIANTGRSSAITYSYDGYGPAGSRPRMVVTATRIRRPDGELAGTVLVQKPALSMMTLATLGAMGDPGHLERQQEVAAARRRPGAILFADLESSTPLAKRLSTTSYFSLGRRMTRMADRSIVETGGITGRHSGDGVVAFFLAEHLGSESGAARACVEAARTLRSAMPGIAERSGLTPEELTMRFGLHWGSTLYVGLISTVGRTEVTALGDDVNDAARIEPCATGGRILASKALVERLARSDSHEIGLDLDRITYIQLGDLPAATEKARRDAPSLAVCEL
ncbi:MAG: adenylate/guanylate cyclase domain-containing protein [Ilumatobacter sp.]|nr:adenylate/guanylate cyclase domain-containing protein [Ilumatobacter sp.]